MKPIGAKKIESEFADDDVELVLKNGEKHGCSGFIVDNRTHKAAYINTEKSSKSILYRAIDSIADYKNGYNRFCELRELRENILNLLEGSAA